MYSEDVKVVFGFEPSGLFENVIFAPGIGLPRTSSLEAADDDSDVRLIGSALFVVEVELVGVGAGVSFLVILGSVIFGIDGNCPAADWATNDATATAAISMNDDLAINNSPLNANFRWHIL